MALAGCGGNKKKAPSSAAPVTSSSAVGPKARVPAHLGALILDWRPEHRADLESAMKSGLVLLHFDTDGIGPVKGCKGPGEYAFSPTQRMETRLHLVTPDEIKITLPTYGASIAAKLEPELKDGAAIDIAIISVGKMATTWNRLTPKELRGDCGGATHFLKSAAVGAYAVRTGRKGRSRSVDVIMNKPSGQGDIVLQGAGSNAICQKASVIDPEPREGCGFVVGIELQKLE